MIHAIPLSTPFPYTSLFRSVTFWRRSQWKGEPLRGCVFLLDSIGELASMYQLADVAFVGGSLVPRGGHNIVRSEEHTSELQSRRDLVCRLLLEKKKCILFFS